MLPPAPFRPSLLLLCPWRVWPVALGAVIFLSDGLEHGLRCESVRMSKTDGGVEYWLKVGQRMVVLNIGVEGRVEDWREDSRMENVISPIIMRQQIVD